MSDLLDGHIDMPKLESPFVREMVDNRYIVVDKINLDQQWVFLDPNCFPIEKLDGTNVSVIVENGKITRAYNRKNLIKQSESDRLWQGIQASFNHDLIGPYMKNLIDGQHFGELVGEHIQENPMNVKGTLWVPFSTFGHDYLSYAASWDGITKDYESIRKWMKEDVQSKFFALLHDKTDIVPEGVVFHRLSTGEMSKLRSDMFDFWYADPTHRPHKFKTPKPQKVRTGEMKIHEILGMEIGKYKKQFLQNLITHEQYEAKRKEILTKYGIVNSDE